MRERVEPLQAQVCRCLDLPAGQERVVAAGRGFFRLAFDLLGHELRDRLARAVAERAYLGPSSSRAVAGGVSAVCGAEIIDATGRKRKRSCDYSPDKFDTFLEMLGSTPASARFHVETWGCRPETDGGLAPVTALRDSGAFFQVEHLAGGGYLLQATEWFEQYQHEEAFRVFRVLAPALPPGVPRAPRVYLPEWDINLDDDPDFMIVREDPSTVTAAD
jgi:hypothetical protein